MPTTDNPRELALLRLVAHGLVSPRPAAPEHIVERLLCLQAQDYWSGVASVIVRGAASRTEVEATFNTGAVVRAWPLRGSLHLVRVGDLPWLRRLLAPRELAAAARREDRLGITAGVLGRAERIAIELLSARQPCSRAELTAAWRSRGIDTSGPRAYHLIWHLAHTGLLCFGPVREGQQLLVLDQTWLPPTDQLDRVAALERLAYRYFHSHGPATAPDLARWAKLTVADTNHAVAAARRHLTSLTVDDVEYLLGPGTQDELASCRKDADKGVVVLPGFDELLFGYRDRSPTLPDDRSAGVFPRGNGIPVPTVLVAGQVVATWNRPTRHSTAPIEITPFIPISDQVKDTAKRRADGLT
jgi:hypothetical protein